MVPGGRFLARRTHSAETKGESVVQIVRRSEGEQDGNEHHDRLSLRWAFILLTAGIGAAVAASVPGGGVVAAITTGAALLGVLPKVVARR